jgi:hypothetical protein
VIKDSGKIGKALIDIPFDKIYPGMKLKYGRIGKCKVILTKDNADRQILIEWEDGSMTLENHSLYNPVAKLLRFSE